jgi:hypothetical protein
VKLRRSATRTKVLSLFKSRSAAVKDIRKSFRTMSFRTMSFRAMSFRATSFRGLPCLVDLSQRLRPAVSKH